MNEHIKIGDRIQIHIRKMGINGEGIGYYQKLAIFVDQALPNEKLEVEITEVFDNRAVAEIVEIISESPDRITPFCPVYQICGGCQTQHYDYEKTLIQKRDLIIQSFDRYIKKKINPSIIKNTIGAKNPKNYRNKASLPVQKIRGKNVFGMYAKASNQFVEINECPIQNKQINHILNTIISLMDQYQIDAIDPKTKRGYVRSLVVRVSETTQEAQVSLIMAKKSQRLEQLTEDLIKSEPSVTSVVEVINDSLKKPGFFTNQMRLLHGKTELKESLGGYHFMLKPEAFFQLNSEQAHLFYLEMKRLANLKSHEIAIDAYAGVAPISHYISRDAKHIYAVELDPAACESAKMSLEANHIENVSILQSDFKRALSGLKEKKIDVMFFDPPRTGLGRETIDLILSFKPSRLIYGSCNPSTLAKDLEHLCHDYELIETVPIDMFPYTSLVESVSLLIRK
ncbi:MAG: 23S rRNA (uracil(1939)-C(5))-methyltransferase RlmD [Acholeplasmataceae bacterium]|nr:23S rRNA (uracil(1939)-C(5))-methyltransferase RlmD [Acholeplasmataceae bacterium]